MLVKVCQASRNGGFKVQVIATEGDGMEYEVDVYRCSGYAGACEVMRFLERNMFLAEQLWKREVTLDQAKYYATNQSI